MLISDSTPLSLASAQMILRQFDGVDRPPALAPTPALIRQAVAVVAHHSDYQIFGVCADTLAAACTALAAYLQALDSEPLPAIAPIAGAVYVKYNPKTGLCYASPYLGDHRGVLIACQSAYDGDLNEMFGHLPLDLFQTTGDVD